ncbi:MAG: hypothetical protein NTU83_14295, partial [Candidatus Hydrogenedentes bacterium]|nr:hypothetical protein [Candidatus Hydrogenedentota bacterium]
MKNVIRVTVAVLATGIALGAWAQEGVKEMKTQTLMAGFARTDITPAVGCEMPGGFEKNFAKSVHDTLYVEAAVFMNGGVGMAIVGMDTIMAPLDVVAEARLQVEARTGIPRGNILIAASHTHNGGPIIECFSVESDPAYGVLVPQRIVEAIVQAHA